MKPYEKERKKSDLVDFYDQSIGEQSGENNETMKKSMSAFWYKGTSLEPPVIKN